MPIFIQKSLPSKYYHNCKKSKSLLFLVNYSIKKDTLLMEEVREVIISAPPTASTIQSQSTLKLMAPSLY